MTLDQFCLISAMLGYVLWIAGLCFYAKAKGYSAVLGLLGLFSCLGWVILAVAPDRAKDAEP